MSASSGEMARRLGINDAFFDLDDTLTGNTHALFVEKMALYATFLSQLPNCDFTEQEVEAKLTEVNNIVYKKESVNPNRWVSVIREVAGELRIDRDLAMEGKPILDTIYTTEVVWAEGAEEMLESFVGEGMGMYLVTHANAKWTCDKYEWMGLNRFFPPKNVYIVSEDVHKAPIHWSVEGAMRLAQNTFYNKMPRNMMATGDSVGGDIIPAVENNYGLIVHVLPKWSLYGVGKLPLRVHQIPAISKMKSKLEEIVYGN